MLQQAGNLANNDPAAAWQQLEELSGKTTTAQEVMHLAGFAANLGSAVLRRDADTIAFLDRLLGHPFAESDAGLYRSILRAKAVIHHCADEEEQAEACKAKGVTNATEQCRLAIMCAQTLVARQQANRAIPFLKQSSALCQELADDDEIVQQVATIAANVLRLAETQHARARELLLASSSAVNEALARHPQWQHRHMGLFQRAKAQILAGNPNQALNAVQRMMALEQEHGAEAYLRFQTASLACRAQLLRGQVKIANGAFQACKHLAVEVGDQQQRQQLDKAIEELAQQLAEQRDRSNTL
jgi:hypothetical protein